MTTYNVRRLVSGLSDTVHTVKVVVLGQRRVGSSGTTICLDHWVVG